MINYIRYQIFIGTTPVAFIKQEIIWDGKHWISFREPVVETLPKR